MTSTLDATSTLKMEPTFSKVGVYINVIRYVFVTPLKRFPHNILILSDGNNFKQEVAQPSFKALADSHYYNFIFTVPIHYTHLWCAALQNR